MLREVCESDVLANQMFGTILAKHLKSRLADLRAVDNISQLPVGNPRPIIFNDEKSMEIDLHLDETLVICANHNNNPQLPNSNIDWARVTRIKVCSIGGYCD